MSETLHHIDVLVGAIGTLGIVASAKGIVTVAFRDWIDRPLLEPWLASGCTVVEGENRHLVRFRRELARYGAGERMAFTVAVDLRHLPDFTIRVLHATRRIPFGRVASYGEVGDMAGNARAARAVGQAMHRNPTPILIPCHRVIASGGRIGGFTPGPELKRLLFAHEGIDSVR